MIPNTSDGSSRPPRLRCYLNLMALEDLPVEAPLEAIAQAGYEGVQFTEPVTPQQLAACNRLGLGKAGSGRVNRPEEAATLAARFCDEGLECATLHVGWGMEDDDEAARLIDAVLDASVRCDLPLYVETHRATIFQDMWRTVQFVRRFPELRFNGDFSHWYTGLEMVYGGFEKKLEYIRPVLDRVRFIHGRIGTPGCIQVDVGDGQSAGRPYVDHFRTLWVACWQGFCASAHPGDYLLFVPELLSSRIYYSIAVEQSDRWAQSLVLRRIAQECMS
jgi:hypothetical protein